MTITTSRHGRVASHSSKFKQFKESGKINKEDDRMKKLGITMKSFVITAKKNI